MVAAASATEKKSAKAPKAAALLPVTGPDQIARGMRIKDLTTGLTGICQARSDLLAGSIQFDITPEGDGKTVPDGRMVDWQMLAIVDDGLKHAASPPDPNVTIRLGEQVKDEITGLEGIASDKITFFNGCVYFGITPKIEKKTPGKAPSTVLYDHKRLKRIGAGVAGTKAVGAEESAPKVKKAEKDAAPKAKPPGGPTRRSSDMIRG